MVLDKSVITLVGLVAAVFAVCSIKPKESKENFLGNLPSMQTKVWRSVGNQKGDFYSIPGQYQAMLSPRMNGQIDFGANIRYNVPSEKHMASPRNPVPLATAMDMSNMVNESYERENYDCGSCSTSAAGCKKSGLPLDFKQRQHGVNVPAGYAAGNFNDVTQKVYEDSSHPAAESMLPVGTMTTINALGETVQPIVYDRFVYANRNSRLRGQGDMIRGDLAIVPHAPEWFRPSVHPSIDLQEGAMNVMGGIGNSTSQDLAQLITSSSAGTATTIGGINTTNMFQTHLGSGLNDVAVSAFP